MSEGDVVGPALGRLLEHGFDLAPGTRRRFFWHFPASPSSTPSGEQGAPAMGSIRTSYVWQPANDRPERSFEEQFDYNVGDLMILAPVPWTGPTASNDQGTKNIVHSIRAVAHNVAENNR